MGSTTRMDEHRVWPGAVAHDARARQLTTELWAQIVRKTFTVLASPVPDRPPTRSPTLEGHARSPRHRRDHRPNP
jgi:hypothetical protein